MLNFGLFKKWVWDTLIKTIFNITFMRKFTVKPTISIQYSRPEKKENKTKRGKYFINYIHQIVAEKKIAIRLVIMLSFNLR